MIDRVNGEGRFQTYSFIVFFLIWFFISWMLLGMSFFFDDSFTCKDDFPKEKDCRNHICSLPVAERKDAIATHSASVAF